MNRLVFAFVIVVAVFGSFSLAADSSLVKSLSLADASFIGEAPETYSGYSLSDAGDVNGDGYDDILIGTGGGKAYVVLGSADGWTMDIGLATSNACISGESGYLPGDVVSSAGDVNGDGYDDILYNGKDIYLFLGSPERWSDDVSISEADTTFDGSAYSISNAGDVNGDGYDDMLMGEIKNHEKKYYAGKSYLFFGSENGLSKTVSPFDADASFLGEKREDKSGNDVSSAGDVNGDGYDDMLIAAWENDEGGIDAGQVYLFFGSSDGWSIDASLSAADASFIGESKGDKAGVSIGSAGDVNGDGYDDILIGAFYNDEGGIDAGQVYLILGSSDGWSRDMHLSDAGASFVGENPNDNAGYALSSAGDVNGDGYDDILISAIYNDERGYNSGKTYLLFGSVEGWQKDMSLSEADVKFSGEDYGDKSGFALSDAGDVNEDGYGDILTSTIYNDEGGLNAGQTYLILGRSEWDDEQDDEPENDAPDDPSPGGGPVIGSTIVTHSNSETVKVEEIVKGEKATLKFTKSSTALTKIALTAKKSISGVEIRVDTGTPRPKKTTKSAPEGKVYRYVTVEHETLKDEDIGSVDIYFKIEKAWMDGKNIETGDIVLARYEDGTWNQLETKKVGSDKSHYTFKAISPGLSIFAIKTYDEGEAPEKERDMDTEGGKIDLHADLLDEDGQKGGDGRSKSVLEVVAESGDLGEPEKSAERGSIWTGLASLREINSNAWKAAILLLFVLALPAMAIHVGRKGKAEKEERGWKYGSEGVQIKKME